VSEADAQTHRAHVPVVYLADLHRGPHHFL
jgi:hypothetical protein